MFVSNTREGGRDHPSWSYHCKIIPMPLSLLHLGSHLRHYNHWASTLHRLQSWCPLSHLLQLYPLLTLSNFNKVSKTRSNHTLRFNHKPKNAIYSSLFCRILKHHIQTIFGTKWYSKPKNVVKFVKGLLHLCPSHQLNPKRGLIMYTRWITT